MNHVRKNILIVGPSPLLLGGVSKSVRDFLESNLKTKYNLKYFQTGKGRLGSLSTISTIRRAVNQLGRFISRCIKEEIDIVHIHTSSFGGFWRFSLYVFFCRILSNRVILHIHGAGFKGFFHSRNFFLKKLLVKALESANMLIVLSNSWKIFFESIAPKVEKRVVENSVPFTRENVKINHSSSEINILFLGMFRKRKGVNELLEAIPIIKRQNKNVNFVIAGFPRPSEFFLFEQLQNGADNGLFDLKINVSENKKKQLYQNSHIFILQSFDEGLPFTILEAMSYGLPVITTPVGAISEVIKEMENGFLIQPGKYSELVEKILFLIDNPEIRKTMGNNNLGKIKEYYSHEAMIEKIDKIYKSL